MKAGRIRWLVVALILAAPVAALADGPGILDQLKKSLAGTKITLAQIIATAQKQVADGQVLAAEIDWEKQPPDFAVVLLVGDKLKQVKLDVTGKVLGVTEEPLDKEAAEELEEGRKSLAAAKVTFAQAIEAAEKELKDGRAFSAALEAEEGRASYTVTLLQGDKVMEAEIDAATGKVTKTGEESLPLALWAFDQGDVGKPPLGLLAKETHPGQKLGEWKIAADPTAPTKPNVLTLTTAEAGDTFNLALFEKTAYKDLDVRVRLRANAGKEDQGGGLVWRCKDENNYYVCRINPLENNFRVYKVVGGKREQLLSVDFKAETGKWYQVRAVMVGDKITCYVDGQKLLEIKDDTFKDAGLIGLWTKADASSSFDNLVVDAPKAEKPEEEAKAPEKAEPKKEGKGGDDDDDDK